MWTPGTLQVCYISLKIVAWIEKNYGVIYKITKTNNFITISLESMETCGIATLEKCTAMSDDQRPKNMIEVSGCNFQLSPSMDWCIIPEKWI